MDIERIDNYFLIKCRKCRGTLLNSHDTEILGPHSDTLKFDNLPSNSDTCPDCRVFYISEMPSPSWVFDTIDAANWLKGKLKCPDCGTSVGSFNFIQTSLCSCKKHIVPPIHINRCKVDVCNRKKKE